MKHFPASVGALVLSVVFLLVTVSCTSELGDPVQPYAGQPAVQQAAL